VNLEGAPHRGKRKGAPRGAPRLRAADR